ncbi:MAG: hypothetical protein RLZZ06_364 [Actinomycetota bacterium]|jgi:hypothetical protein
MSEKNEAPIKPKKVRAPKPAKVNREDLPNPVWFKPVMFGFMLLGLIWILTFYISSMVWPLGSGWTGSLAFLNLGNGNIAVGFGLLMVGFFMTTRWK